MRRLKMPSLLQASTAALVGRTAMLVAGMGNSLLLPLLLDQQGVGAFFILQIFIAGAAIVALCGFTFSIPTIITAAMVRGDLGAARRAAIQMGALSLAIGITIGIATILLGREFLAKDVHGEWTSWAGILWVTGAIIPFTCQTALMAELLRAIHAYKSAGNLVAIAACFTLAFLIARFLAGNNVTLLAVLLAALTGSVVSSAIGLAIAVKHMRNWRKPPVQSIRISETLRVSLPNLLSTLVLFTLTQFDILLLSFWMGMEQVASYGIATRVSALLIIPLSIANTAIAPIAVELRTTDREFELQRLLTRLSLACTVLAIVPFLLFAIAGSTLIDFWNPQYHQVYGLVLLLGAGQVVHASCGAAGMLLMTSGQQMAAMRITMFTGLITVTLCIIGLAVAGSMGVAAGAAIGNGCQALAFSLRARTHLHLRTSLFFRRPLIA